LIKTAKLNATWYDKIDTNPSYKTDNFIKATAEYIWSIIEWVGDPAFPVNIHWKIEQ